MRYTSSDLPKTRRSRTSPRHNCPFPGHPPGARTSARRRRSCSAFFRRGSLVVPAFSTDERVLCLPSVVTPRVHVSVHHHSRGCELNQETGTATASLYATCPTARELPKPEHEPSLLG